MPLETIYIARHGFRQGFDVPKSASRALSLLSFKLTVILSAIRLPVSRSQASLEHGETQSLRL